MTGSPPQPGGDANRPALSLGHPPSLCRRAPAKVELSDAHGRGLTVTRRGVHLTAGRRLRVKVTPPKGDGADGWEGRVTAAPDQTLETVGRLSKVGEGPSATYHGEFRGRLSNNLPQFIRDRVPLPCRGELVVTVEDGKHDPVRVVVPVIVWPSTKTLLLSGFFAVTLLYAGPQFLAQFGRAGGDPIPSAVTLLSDPRFVGWWSGLTVTAAFAFHLLGAILVFIGMAGEGD